MSTEKPQIIITNSNGQEQSDSYQNSIFENVSEQQEKLFCRVTSSDNQPKNQQPNVEAIPQQEMQYQECNENMQDPYLSSVSPNVMPQQGSYNVPAYQTGPSSMISAPNAMPQQGTYNIPQTVSAPQNIVQPAMSNSNTQQQGEQKQTYRHTYCPVVMEDCNACLTYIAQANVSADSRFSVNREMLASMICKNELKSNTTEIARLYINTAQDYGTKYRVDVEYMDAEYHKQHQIVFLDKEDCTQGRIVQVFKKNGICCFNTNLSQKKISDYLYDRIQARLQNEKHELPAHSGFQEIDGSYCFVTSEYCDKEKLPRITEKTFLVSNQLYSETAEFQFCQLAQQHSSVKQFLLLNMLRIIGLLSTPWMECGIRWSRVVFLCGSGEKLSRYLQIYERDREIQRPHSVNVKKEELESYFKDEKDTVVMLEDFALASDYLKKNGVNAVAYLNNEIFDRMNSCSMDYNYLTVVFSERLGQLMPHEKGLVLPYQNFSVQSEISWRTLFSVLYYLDKKIVEYVCSDIQDYRQSVRSRSENYAALAKSNSVDGNVFSCLMMAYDVIVKQYQSVEQLVSRVEMQEYLFTVIQESERSYNGGSIAEEFQEKLNAMLVNRELELVENSCLNQCYGTSGTVPILYHDENWLYFPAETFEYLASKVTLANCVGNVRKALKEKGWLRMSENMTYKATLYDTWYNGKVNVTAVSDTILSDAAAQMQLGGMFNFTPYSAEDAGKRILLGKDEKDRNVYWSIQHEDLINRHMLVNGTSGSGKTTAVNQIVKELLRQGHHIVYLDFSHSCTPKQLASHGIEETFQKDNILRSRLESVLENPEELTSALEIVQEENSILLFETETYSDEVESFLTLLYEKVSEREELEIFLVIDEVHELNYAKGSPLYHIMEIGRRNGISLISIFQGPHQTKPKQYSMMNQSDIKLIFKLTDRKDAEDVAKSDELKPPGKFIEKIRKLAKHHCLVIGNLEDSDGELENDRFVEVTVPEI